MRFLVASIALVAAFAVSAEEKFHIRGVSWHLGYDGIAPYMASLGLECKKSPFGVSCYAPETNYPLVSFDHDVIMIRPRFTNTENMDWKDVAQFIVNNKPIDKLAPQWQPGNETWILQGLAHDGQQIKLDESGWIWIWKGRLGAGGPTM